jgi:non-specific serine/threonine protein kinase
LQAEEARPHFIIRKNSHYTVQCRVKAGGIEYDLADNESNSPLFFLYNHQIYLWKSNDVIHLIDKFLPEGKMNVPAEEWSKTLTQFILPLAKEHKVDFDRSTGPGNKRRQP